MPWFSQNTPDFYNKSSVDYQDSAIPSWWIKSGGSAYWDDTNNVIWDSLVYPWDADPSLIFYTLLSITFYIKQVLSWFAQSTPSYQSSNKPDWKQQNSSNFFTKQNSDWNDNDNDSWHN